MLTISRSLLPAALLLVQLSSISSAPAYLEKSYLAHPNEVLPIEPVQIYPNRSESEYHVRKLAKDSKLFYIKLHKPKSYRPKKDWDKVDTMKNAAKNQIAKEIFYVKSLTNGHFSHNRVKVYRTPEFNAIRVFHKGDICK